ncbi:MAG: DUF4342 domain-containing protein [Patescibacteria group bacterium]|jgi:CBS domain-containing protein|nr:DUF4342 domain-containing protein [bacterium]HQC49655.1 DUF4342 domain-containing protein [bacterium]
MPTKKDNQKTKQTKQAKTEKFQVTGDEILKKVKKLIKEGNIRRMVIKNEKGVVIMEVPVTVAVVGTVFAPILAAIGALAALLTQATIEVERRK